MKQEIKERWVEALTSGEFEQGSGSLCAHGKYCCLGVLTELAAREGVVSRVDHQIDDETFVRYISTDPKTGESEEDTAVLSDAVIEWAGINQDDARFNHNPWVVIEGDQTALAVHNDSGRTFAEIAKAIKEQL